MWVKFNPQLPWQVEGCLSSEITRRLGVEVWHLSQHDQQYCIKFLTYKAAINNQQAYQNELNFYQKQLGLDQTDVYNSQYSLRLSLNAQIIAKSEFLTQAKDLLEISSDILVLAYATPLDQALVVQQNAHFQLKYDWFRQALHLISGLQKMGYLHGDLKLQNLVIEQGQLKLIDFAQIQDLKDGSTVAEKGGTPAYMAPELFLGQPKTIQSEIYALGIIFYQLLINKKPFIAKSYQQWALQHCQQAIPLLPSELQSYQNVLDKMLAKRVENRFVKLEEIENALNLINFS